MEAVWAGLIALASAVIVKVLDYIFSRNDKTTKTLNEIKSDIGSVRKELSRVDQEACKNYLVTFLSEIERGHKMDEIELERFWEQYKHYIEGGGNSYIKRRVEKYRDDGRL